MNKNVIKFAAAAAFVLTTGCVTAGTWVNGYYVDGPLCTVCDGTRVVQHAYGTTVCAHCEGTGIEPPEETVVVENVVYDTWCPPPPPPPRHHHRPVVHRRTPQHRGGGHPKAHRAPARPARGGHRQPARQGKGPRGRGR